MCPILKNTSLPSGPGGGSTSGRYGRMPAQAVMTAPACRGFTTAFFRASRSRYHPDAIGMQNALYPSARMTQGWDRAPFCFPKKVRILRLVGYNDEYLPAWIL